MINLMYQYKLEPTKAQSQTMSDWLETSRKVWNYALGGLKLVLVRKVYHVSILSYLLHTV